MKKIFIASVSIALLCGFTHSLLVYPETKKGGQTDDYFGTKIADPYRWLEDDNSKETAEWVTAQNKVTYDYLGKIPFRAKIKERLSKIWNYEKQSIPSRKGDYYFFSKNDGMQNQSVLYVMGSVLPADNNRVAAPRVLLDPNKMDAAGTTSLGGTYVREDGKYMAYSVSKAGSDWSIICALEVESGKVLSDTIKWVKFSGASWAGNGFYYSAYDAPKGGHELSTKNQNSRVYYHKLGTKQKEDALIYEDPSHPFRGFNMRVSDNGKIASLSTSESTSGNALQLKNMATTGSRTSNDAVWHVVDSTFRYDYDIIEYLDDNSVLVLTNNGAPKKRIIKIQVDAPSPSDWKVIIPESKDLLEGIELAGGKIVASYLHDVSTQLKVYSMEGKFIKDISLPGLGISGFGGSKKDSTAFYSFTNFVTPTAIYKYNMNTGKSESYWSPTVDVDPSKFESKQVFYASKDGTKIPMFITYKKGTKIDGTTPCFLYGYGGFDISVTPGFTPTTYFFMEAGGIYAVANLRGGGEYGEDWHWAGTKCKKQNVFDDFIAAAEYLVTNKYTSHSKLAIHGRSNGGLLVGATMTQRPDICKVALPGVGVLDMLRYHTFTIGHYWAADYGRSDVKEEFDCLIKYSPLHNVKAVAYPATMITTGDHDDRVVPAHSFKFAAELQSKQKGDNPTLIRIDVNAGHGAGKPTSKQIDEWSDVWAFTMFNLGMVY